MDLKLPIDITAVNKAVEKHKDVLKALDMMDVNEVLQDCTPYPGVTGSITLGRVEGGKISSKYTGVFLGENNIGKVVPRDLKVYPVVAEMADEPERYRRTFLTEVSGGMWDKKHPFELWIIQHGINLASQDLHNAIFVAKYDADPEKKSIEDSFHGWGTILMEEKTAGNLSVDKKNIFATGAITRANAGDVLLQMWRNMPKTFREKQSIIWLSHEVGDLYDDWLKDETTQLDTTDQAGAQYLKGTKRLCKLKRTAAFPEGSQLVILTTRANMVYGFDKMSDLKSMKPFPSGNPYVFTATMKYVWGTQFVSINPKELCINDQPLTLVK